MPVSAACKNFMTELSPWGPAVSPAAA